MPELPEVEITRRGILPVALNNKILAVKIRNPRLRFPIPENLPSIIEGHTIQEIKRRGRYLLCRIKDGNLLIHLGMAGKLTIVPSSEPEKKHDHFIINFASQFGIRLNDPRRFSAVLWLPDNEPEHALLKKLGPEPLSEDFTPEYLYKMSQKRRMAIKPFLMDNQVVVGVGNIYATEVLFHARINPLAPANELTIEHCTRLVEQIKLTLQKALQAGGTTLKDFYHSEGKPGYFKQELKVYGREGEACVICAQQLSSVIQGQRKTVYCKNCQTI